MRSDRPDSPRRGEKRRMISIGPVLERLECRDLMALVVGPITSVDGVPFSGKVASFAANDISGTLADYKASINWGDSSATNAALFSPDPAGGFDVIAPKTYTTPGRYTVVVTVAGTNNMSITSQGIATVVTSPVTLTGTSISPVQGMTDSFIVASFVADPTSNPGDFTAAIDWGANPSPIPGVIARSGPITSGSIIPVPGEPGHFNVSGSYQYAEAGTFTITVGVKPNAGNTPANAFSTAFVSAATIPPTTPLLKVTGIPITSTNSTTPAPVTAGVPFTVPVASFFYSGASPSAGQFAATVAWGPGLATTSAAILPVTGAPGLFAVNGSFTYPTAGTYPISVNVVNLANGISGGATTQATVAAAMTTSSLVGTGGPIVTTAGETFSGRVASFSDSSSKPSTNPGDFPATIDWGDRQGPTTATVVYDPVSMNFAVYGSKNYAVPPGIYPVTVTVSAKQPFTINSSAAVYAFTGALGSPIGPGSTSTNKNQPTFLGTAEPNAIVRLFGQKPDGSPAIPLGETVAGSNGAWKLTALPLPDATYSLIGVAVPTTGSPYPPALLTTFVLDTVAPKVVGLGLVTSTGKLTVTFQDDRSGLDASTLANLGAYELIGPGRTIIKASAVRILPGVATLPSDPRSVVVTFALTSKNHGGRYSLKIAPGTIGDRAGNPLAGEVFGNVPTTKGHPAPSHPTGKAKHRR